MNSKLYYKIKNFDKIYVISCERDTDRQRFVREQMASVDMPFSFFKATDGYKTFKEEFAKENIYGDHLGMMGCALSHKRIWQEMVDNDYEQVMIFEDDVIFHEKFVELFSHLVKYVPNNYGIIFLGYCAIRGPSGKDCWMTGCPLGAHAYILKQNCARYLLDNFYTDNKGIDVYIRHKYYNVPHPDWESYCIWADSFRSKYNIPVGLDGAVFFGLVFQNRNTIPLAINRNINNSKILYGDKYFDKIYVISCQEAIERQNFVKEQMKSVNLPFEFFPASDGYKMNTEKFERENIFIEHKGVRGCALSHKRIWQEILAKNYDQVMIFEDDVIFHEKFVELYNHLVNCIPNDYGTIFLGHCMLAGPANKDCWLYGMPSGAHAYIITHKAAKYFLDNFDKLTLPIDDFMRHTYDTIPHDGWTSYAIWTDCNRSKYSYNTITDGTRFYGLVYQNRETIPLSIHRKQSSKIKYGNKFFDKIYVISCKNDHERRKFATEQLNSVNIPFEFYDAVDGFSEPVQTFIDEQIYIEHKGGRGCALSHKRIWQEIVDKKYEQVMIFEDDVMFHEKFHELYNHLVDAVPNDYGIIFIGHNSLVGPKGKDCWITGFPTSLHAYIMTYNAAEFYLNNFNICTKAIDLHILDLYNIPSTRNWSSYALWTGANLSKYNSLTSLNVIFNGLAYQNHDIPLSIHRTNNKK